MKRFATDIVKRSVVTTEGELVGYVNNLVVDTDSGKIKTVLVNPSGNFKIAGFQKDSKGRYMIPLSSMRSFKDVFVLELKTEPKV